MRFRSASYVWQGYWYLTLASGVGLSLLYLASTCQWLFQLKGGTVLLKVALLAVAVRQPEWQGALFTTIILISALMAHAPGSVRGYNWCPPRPGKGKPAELILSPQTPDRAIKLRFHGGQAPILTESNA